MSWYAPLEYYNYGIYFTARFLELLLTPVFQPIGNQLSKGTFRRMPWTILDINTQLHCTLTQKVPHELDLNVLGRPTLSLPPDDLGLGPTDQSHL